MDEIYKHALRVCAIWDAQAFQLMNHCGFNIEPFCSDVCGDHRRPHTLAEICRNMDSRCGFRAVAAREKYPGLTLLKGTGTFINPCHVRPGLFKLQLQAWSMSWLLMPWFQGGQGINSHDID